jgi:ElaB/YqjD/DUF883 family membrane-anchored ribosome-binding protein
MDKDLARELERLQAQVAALTEKIGEPTAAADSRPAGAQASASASFSLGDSGIGEALHRAGAALPEWKEIEASVEALKAELEKHPITGIAVAFALGLTIGQLLRR